MWRQTLDPLGQGSTNASKGSIEKAFNGCMELAKKKKQIHIFTHEEIKLLEKKITQKGISERDRMYWITAYAGIRLIKLA